MTIEESEPGLYLGCTLQSRAVLGRRKQVGRGALVVASRFQCGYSRLAAGRPSGMLAMNVDIYRAVRRYDTRGLSGFW